jgi:peptide/nickel transport system ATP-binding protein
MSGLFGRDDGDDPDADADTRTETTRAEGDDPPLLSIDDLAVEFTPGGMLRRVLTDTTVRAVDGVSFDVEEGDVVALVGESGCGKTTLGKAAVGLQRPTSGSVRYRGQGVWAAKDDPRSAAIDYERIRRSLQIVHQDPAEALNDSRRVGSILSDPLRRWRPELDRRERRETVARYLEYVDMTPAPDYAARYPHQLSGGEKQRVVLGRSLLINPDLVLADEAVSALDVSLRVEIMDLMIELQELFDTSYLFVSHDLANARYFATQADGKLAVMYLGEIVEYGPVDEVLSNPQHPYTEVLLWSTPAIDPDIAQEAIDEEPPLRRVDVPDAEDPPTGCKFHTRCVDAREACREARPPDYAVAGSTAAAQGGGAAVDSHRAACYRAGDDPDYRGSEPLTDEEPIGLEASDI